MKTYTIHRVLSVLVILATVVLWQGCKPKGTRKRNYR